MAGERINNPATKSGCSSVGRTPHLGCGGREFKPHHSDQPLQDAASVHVVALLSSMVLGITQNCPSGYSGLAQRFVYVALTHVKVVRPHHPLPKPTMGVHVNPPIKWRSSSSVVLGKPWSCCRIFFEICA